MSLPQDNADFDEPIYHQWIKKILDDYNNFTSFQMSTSQQDSETAQEKLTFALLLIEGIDFEKDQKMKFELLNNFDILSHNPLIEKAVEKGAVYNFSNNEFYFITRENPIQNKYIKALIKNDLENFISHAFKKALSSFIQNNNQEMILFLANTFKQTKEPLDLIVKIMNSPSQKEALALTQNMDLTITQKLEEALKNSNETDQNALDIAFCLFKYAEKFKKNHLTDILLVQTTKNQTSLQNQLITALENKDLKIAYILLEQGADKNKKIDSYNSSPSIYVKYYPLFQEIERLYYPKKHQMNKLLLKAVQENNTKSVQELIQKGADVNTRFENLRSPLHIAVLNKNVKLIQTLIQNNADTNAQDNKKVTPLLLAAFVGDVKVFEPLYQQYKKMVEEEKKRQQETGVYVVHEVLGCGLRYYHYDKFIPHPDKLNLYFELDAQNPEDIFYNMIQDEASLTVAVYFGHQEIVDLLLKDNVNLENGAGEENETVLIIASQKGNYKMVEKLLNKKAKINHSICANDNDALKYAISNNHTDIAKLLIKRGATMERNALSSSISTLAFAVYNNNKELVELLLEKGAHPEACTSMHYSALAYGVIQNNLEIVKLLLSKGATVKNKRILAFAIQNKNKEMIKLLVENGADINARISPSLKGDTESKHLVKLDFFTDDAEIKALLYQLGLKKDISNFELLQEAIDKFDTKAVKELVKVIPDLNQKNSDGDTPLMLAFRKYTLSKDIVTLLIENGADVTVLDAKGNNLLDVWDYPSDIDLFELIVSKKPRLNPQNASKYIQKSIYITSDKLLKYMAEEKITLPPIDVEESVYTNGNYISSACQKSKNVCAFLLDNGYDINTLKKDESHFILNLISNSIEDKENFLQFLIDKGVDLKATTIYSGDGVLHQLAYLQDVNILRLLVKNGADVNLKNNSGATPLMAAVHQETIFDINLDYLKELIRLGADKKAMNDENKTALDVFKDNNFIQNKLYKQICDILK